MVGVTALAVPDPSAGSVARAVARAATYPRLRYMGSKYKLIPQLAEIFAEIGGKTALDAFSGSGVVAYTLKSLGFNVTTNDFLNFPQIIASATVVNNTERLSLDEIDKICGPASDDRDFIRSKFEGLYFDAEDREFLDLAWSRIDELTDGKRSIAISALVLSAARKQPRGVFTFTDRRYDDGRRDLHLPMREHFRACVQEYNAVVFNNGTNARALHGDVANLKNDFDLVYLDPPYAPPKDDNCYIKRYHFLEGLSVYWRGQQIMENTKTKKLAKKYTPFSYKSTITKALRETFERFADSAIVLSYSSNAVPDLATIESELREVKDSVDVVEVSHRYSFGTHSTARRREASEYIFIGR